MKDTKECRVHMLPTNDNTTVGKCVKPIPFGWNYLVGNLYNVSDSTREYFQRQYIYFTSDEEIRENDWYLFEAVFKGGKYDVLQCQDKDEADRCNSHFVIKHACVKVVACTDPSLELPAIPESFKFKYVAADGKIDKVRLAVYWDGPEAVHKPENAKLKLRAGNEVVIVDEPRLPGGTKWSDIEKEGWTSKELPATAVFTLKDGTKKSVELLSNPLEDKGHSLWKEYSERYPGLQLNSGMFLNIFEEGANWRQEQILKESEDTVNDKYPFVGSYQDDRIILKEQNAFSAGIRYQKEQSAKDVVEFAEWLRHTKIASFIPTANGWDWWNNETNEVTTSQQLYELWQNRNK